MTKHGHRTYKEFLEQMNLTDDEKNMRIYELMKERWMYKMRAQFYDMAINNIAEIIEESPRDVDRFSEIKKVVNKLDDRLRFHARW